MTEQALSARGFAPGTVVASHEFLVDEVDLFFFSAACWLPHRIHYDEAFAKLEGLVAVPVHGPMQAAWLVHLAAAWARDNGGQLISSSIRHVNPAYPREELRATITVDEAAARDEIALLLELVNPQGQVTTVGTAVVALHPGVQNREQVSVVGVPETNVDADLSSPTQEVFEVSRESIKRFALTCGLSDAEHTDLDSALSLGHHEIVAPAYFFVSLGLAMDHTRLRSALTDGGIANNDPLASAKVVAGQTTVRWFGDIHAGDAITVTRRFVDVEKKLGRSGPFEVCTFEREYSRNGELLIRETYGRVAR